MQIAATNPSPPIARVAPTQTRSENEARPDPEGESARGEQTDRSESDAQRGPLELTEAEQAQVRELQQRDREVRAHELAHVAAGGAYVTAPASYQYEVGPDGRRYAVGGEVSIDTSVPSDPEEALAKAQIIQRAALAPVDPSAQDYQVAAKARQMAIEARSELAAERLEETSSAGERAEGERGPDQSDEAGVAAAAADRVPLVTEQSLAPQTRFSLFA
ncbi:putative metalloprotease CJM1_0395 family protein [Wenzhouxiangella limi]|uniref:SprA-related family protein n=1 Tax=Wenzhouxiangella limi TaxID=2707351 RepID=A0A845UZ14_9GAMM|nr:putative metalloprotease CJM1_0395 family protein [Wenzhouxiangella limi]NDY97073.1 hypothetical protein [Wenzhouxiangella limi]